MLPLIAPPLFLLVPTTTYNSFEVSLDNYFACYKCNTSLAHIEFGLLGAGYMLDGRESLL